MKIAICLSGQLRNFDTELVTNQFNKFVTSLNGDIFISTWSDGVDSTMISQRYKNIKSIDINNYDDWYNNIDEKQKKIINQPNPPHKSTSYQQLYLMYKSNELKRNYEIKNHFKYDLCIRMRPDLLFVSNFDFNNILSNSIYTMNFPPYNS